MHWIRRILLFLFLVFKEICPLLCSSPPSPPPPQILTTGLLWSWTIFRAYKWQTIENDSTLRASSSTPLWARNIKFCVVEFQFKINHLRELRQNSRYVVFFSLRLNVICAGWYRYFCRWLRKKYHRSKALWCIFFFILLLLSLLR